MNYALIITAVNGFLVVLLGAFGAHALEAILSQQQLGTWDTAVQYHMFHTAALFGTGLLAQTRPDNILVNRATNLFLGGIVTFCGSLYILALTGINMLGMITPIGGVMFLGAWACLFYAIVKGAKRG